MMFYCWPSLVHIPGKKLSTRGKWDVESSMLALTMDFALPGYLWTSTLETPQNIHSTISSGKDITITNTIHCYKFALAYLEIAEVWLHFRVKELHHLKYPFVSVSAEVGVWVYVCTGGVCGAVWSIYCTSLYRSSILKSKIIIIIVNEFI